MQVSAIPNTNNNFGKTMPVLKFLKLGKNGQEVALRTLNDQRGPMQAFMLKINNDQYCPEGIFMRRWFTEFRNYPFAASTSMATDKRYLVFGSDDIDTLRELCTDHYRKGIIAKEDVEQSILERLIEPFAKKYRHRRFIGDTKGEPVGIVLHANKVKSPKGKGKVYNFGIDITDETGKTVYAVLPSAVPQVAALQPKVNFVLRQPKLIQQEFSFMKK
ncbi:MAG: hypothetical protein K6A44_04210 [bacterium]|nr:hypothetical protein [bacterium]